MNVVDLQLGARGDKNFAALGIEGDERDVAEVLRRLGPSYFEASQIMLGSVHCMKRTVTGKQQNSRMCFVCGLKNPVGSPRRPSTSWTAGSSWPLSPRVTSTRATPAGSTGDQRDHPR